MNQQNLSSPPLLAAVLCVDRSLHFCLNAPETYPEMGFVTHEQTMALTDPDGNCWQFSGFYPKNWTMHVGRVCVRQYGDVDCSEKPTSSDVER